MNDEVFERYRRLLRAMKRKGLIKSAAEGYAMLVRIQQRKNISDTELLERLGF